MLREFIMARVCDICGKGLRTGNIITRRGLPKAKGGIGLHTTGITRRRFLPNLQKIRVMENGGIAVRKVCTACIKSGKVAKAGKRVGRKV
jgi:large subunit ribosomal protein L28